MLGSAGVVVLNEHTDMVAAALAQMRFFRDESCGQCAPCRVGTQVLVTMLERVEAGTGTTSDLDTFERVGWEMEAGSICGLGQAAPYPVTHLLRFWPEELRRGIRA
jgi:NADP-reducing hydrogenase subunit HndC